MTTDLYAAVPETTKEKLVVLGIKMTPKMRHDWKAHCDKHNIDMSEVIRRFIAAELGKVAS